MAGVIGLLLGGLWLLQGLGLVHLQPVLCVAECAPLQGPSPAWAVTGALTAAAGGLAIFFSLRRRGGR